MPQLVQPMKTLSIVTGATGTLGSILCSESLVRGYKTVACYRDEEKLGHLIRSLTFGKLNDVTSYYLNALKPSSNLKTMQDKLLDSWDSFDHIVLINNAGFLGFGNSFDVLDKSLKINSLFPYYLSNDVMSMYRDDLRITVINVSSGDGELTWLHSDFQQQLNEIGSLEVCIN
jgi:short-subunit dehydrogenase